jgi:hypothetical protein
MRGKAAQGYSAIHHKVKFPEANFMNLSCSDSLKICYQFPEPKQQF